MSLLSNLITGITATSAVGAALIDHEVPRKLSALLDRSVYLGPSSRHSVALTFDDGPSPQTPAVLELLARMGVHATFFQTGVQVERFPAIARQVYAAGHEIGNHGWSHVSLSPRLRRPLHLPSLSLIHREIAKTQQLLTEVHHHAPRWFRPPFGHRWWVSDAIQRRLGLRCIQWSVIGHDWEWPADRIADRILSQARPGAILCLHDGRDVQPEADLGELLKALEVILPALQAEGYQFETLSEMLLSQADAALLATPQQQAKAQALTPAPLDVK